MILQIMIFYHFLSFSYFVNDEISPLFIYISMD